MGSGEPFRVGDGVRLGTLAVLLVLFQAGAGLERGLRGDVVNPDSFMRLVRLREMLVAGAPVDVVWRDGSGQGVLLQWSHLLDSALLLVAAPFAPWLGWDAALRAVAVGFGPFCLGALAAALAWAVAPLATCGWRLLLPVQVGIAPLLVGYGVPGVVHHQVLLVLCAVMVAGWAGRAVCGVPLGAWGAVGLWLSPETAPFTLAGLGAIGISWLVRPSRFDLALTLRDAGTSLAMCTAAALAADPPLSDPLAPALDRLSVTWLGLGIVCCAVGWGVRSIASRDLAAGWARALGAVAMVAPALLWIAAVPGVLGGPDGVLPAAEASAFFGVIAEFHPAAGLGEGAHDLSTGILAALAAALVAGRTRSPAWAWVALCAVLAVGLGVSHHRFAAYSEALSAAALPIAMTWCSRALAEQCGRGLVTLLARPGNPVPLPWSARSGRRRAGSGRIGSGFGANMSVAAPVNPARPGYRRRRARRSERDAGAALPHGSADRRLAVSPWHRRLHACPCGLAQRACRDGTGRGARDRRPLGPGLPQRRTARARGGSAAPHAHGRAEPRRGPALAPARRRRRGGMEPVAGR